MLCHVRCLRFVVACSLVPMRIVRVAAGGQAHAIEVLCRLRGARAGPLRVAVRELARGVLLETLVPHLGEIDHALEILVPARSIAGEATHVLLEGIGRVDPHWHVGHGGRESELETEQDVLDGDARE